MRQEAEIVAAASLLPQSVNAGPKLKRAGKKCDSGGLKIHLVPPALVVSKLGHRAEASYLGLLNLVGHCDEHAFVADPLDADIVLAPIYGDSYGLFFEKLRASPIYRVARCRLFVYTIDDFQFPALPGIYPSISPAWAERKWAVGGHYITNYHHTHEFENLSAGKRDILFSFVGSSWTHPFREKVLALTHPRAVLDDSGKAGETVHWWMRGEAHFKDRLKLFERVLSRSKFALCPRGYAAASMRIYQAMQAGAVPVILADDLVLPLGPDWKQFLVRIKEKDLPDVPKILEQLEPMFPEMSVAARGAWEDWFAPERTLKSMVFWCRHLLESTSSAERRRLERLAFLHTWFAPRNIRARLRRVKREVLQPAKKG